MMKTPTVTVLMAMYNGERYLRESIDSILDQTFTDFEFLIVNDGSTDDTAKILQSYHDPRITILHNENNIGIPRSVNKGLRMARGEYIARMDVDDISLPHRFRLQVDYLDTHPGVGALGGAVELIDGQGRTIGKNDCFLEHQAIKALLLVNCFSFYNPTTMMRRNLVQQIGMYNERMKYAQDYDLWWRLSGISCLANLPDVLVQYRCHDKSITTSHREEQLQFAYEISLNAVHTSLRNQSLDTDAYRRLWWTYHSQYGHLDMDDVELRQSDINKLRPFWELLRKYPMGRQVWGPRFLEFAYYLIRHRKMGAGFQLLRVLNRQLGQPIGWECVAKNAVLSLW